MTSAASYRICPQGNPECIDQPLPPWLLHDLLQPLNAYGLAREQLKDAIRPLLAANAALNQDWEVMDNAIHTQERLLRALRQYLNLRTIRSPLDMKGVALATISQQLRIQHEGNMSGRRLLFDGFDDCLVTTHPDRLLELLSCLVENAATYARSRVNLVAQTLPEGIRIDVIDDGEGLEPGVVDLLGMPFLRHARPHPAKRRGLGLGIHIAARNAALLEAPFEFNSLPGGGCCFSVTVPRTDTRAESPVSTCITDPIEGSRILIVDGNKQHGQELQKLLTSWNCRSDFEHNWSTSLFAPIQQGAYDALLINHDIWSRHLSNIDFSGNGDTSALPAIFVMLEKKMASNVALSKASGTQIHILSLPLTPSRLRSALGNALRIQASAPSS